MDFSKPVDSSKNIIDISTDNITTTLRVPPDIPILSDGTLFISDGVMHMLPGIIYSPNGYTEAVVVPSMGINQGLNFNVESKKWDIEISGMERSISRAAIAFDAEKQVGWYYGGRTSLNLYEYGGMSRGLYRLDKGKGAPTRVETDPSSGGDVVEGELVYVKGIGKAGILVLIGGVVDESTSQAQLVSMVDRINNPILPFQLILFFSQLSMQSVHVFDIATEVWFVQPTTAESQLYPPGREQFCSVVASAEDNSSHNIYTYGGWNGSDFSASNGVWILTLPAFHWVPVYPTTDLEANSNTLRTFGHQCQKIHEKHMVAYYGVNFNHICDNELGKFQGMTIYDMSSLKWTTKVELENQKYLVPQVLYQIIGGG